MSFKSLAILASTKLLLNSSTKPPIKDSSVLVVHSIVLKLTADFTFCSIDFLISSLIATAVVSVT